MLAILLVVYIFTGLFGHDPWKHDDAIAIGIANDIAQHGNWLILQNTPAAPTRTPHSITGSPP